MKRLIINAVGFQSIWFALVLGGDGFILVALLWAGFHGWCFAKPGEAQRLAVLALTGLAMDWGLTALGVLSFPEVDWPGLPLWFCGLWLAFPTVLNLSLRWVWSKHWVLIPLSGIGASTTYVGGSRLGPLELPLGDLWTIAVLTAVWTLYFMWARQMLLGLSDTTHAAPSDQSRDRGSSSSNPEH